MVNKDVYKSPKDSQVISSKGGLHTVTE